MATMRSIHDALNKLAAVVDLVILVILVITDRLDSQQEMRLSAQARLVSRESAPETKIHRRSMERSRR
jgi:hypothetical protein